MTTLELLKAYLKAYFFEHSFEKVFELLTEDVHSYGLAEGVEIESLEEARKIVASGKYQQYVDYKLDFLEGKQTFENSAVLRYTLTYKSVCVEYRLAGHSRKTSEGNKLYFINNSIVNPFQTMHMFDDIAHEQRAETARKLLNDTIPGGMMGGYNEPGFPFYFINENMLQYLGYKSENEFVQNIQGMIENCINPEDRENVNIKVASQLMAGDQYEIDYRMLKKDGSYIWVHDVGRRVHTEDGREAILSACYDITSEKEHDRFLESLVASLNGDLTLLNVDLKGRRTIPVYVSDNMGGQQGITKEEYLHQYSQNSMDSIYENDHERVWEAITDAVENDTASSISFRILERDGNTKWMNASFTKHGEHNGLPLIQVLFTPSTIQNDLQLHILNQNGAGIAVIDAETKEIYYVNEGILQMLGTAPVDCIGRKCPDILHDCGVACNLCKMQDALTKTSTNNNVFFNGKHLLVHTEKSIWAGKTVICFYVQDNTAEHLLQEQLEISNKNLRQEQALLQAACASAVVWTWVYYIAEDKIRTSPKLQEDFNLPEYLEHYSTIWPSLSYVKKESAELYTKKVQEIRNGADFVQFEAKVKNKYDVEHYYRIRFQRLPDNSNIAVCTSQIIDDEKIMQARIELERKKMLSSDNGMMGYVITNITKDSVMERDRNRTTGHYAQVGTSLEQAIEKALPDIYSADRERYKEMHNLDMLKAAYQQGKTFFEFIGHRIGNDGALYWMRSTMNLIKDPSTGDILLYEYLYDTHTQKMMEEITVAATASDYDRVSSVNLNADQVTVINLDKKKNTQDIETWSYSERMTNYINTVIQPSERPDMLKKFSINNIIHELADKDSFEFIHHVIEADGSIGCRRTRFAYYDREMRICLMTRADVTEVMRQEEQKNIQLSDALKQAHEALEIARKATQAKSEFLSRMSHEIRTPMNAILGMTAIVKENSSDFRQVAECIDKIDMSSHFLLALINDILEMNRIESGHTEVKHNEFSFDLLIESIRTVIEPLALRSNIRYEFSNKSKTDSHYIGDTIRIQQVIVNIITNAIKFTKPGGRVRFSIEIEDETPEQTHFAFIIADTGIGMSKEFMQHMFHPFTQEDSSNTSEFGGSGLGLAISKSLVEVMGGSIEVESFIKVGSTFTIRLPLDRMSTFPISDTENENSAKSEIDLQILKGCQVLMAEDHPLNVMVAKKILERQGVLLTVADNGMEAIDAFRISEPGHYDAILMDIRMPKMDGWDATIAIRAMDRTDAKSIPIIAMTANALEEDRQRSNEVGMDAHLAKPFEPTQLYSILVTQIKKYRTKEKNSYEPE